MNQEQSTAGITFQNMAHLGPVGQWLMLARYHLKCRGILKRLASGGSSDRPEEELSRVIRWAGFSLGPELKEALSASE